jgi:hypothetical protein
MFSALRARAEKLAAAPRQVLRHLTPLAPQALDLQLSRPGKAENKIL